MFGTPIKQLLQPEYSLDRFKGDLFGGLTVAVVVLPLSIAFGVASGLGPNAGLYGAIAVGFFAAVFGGTSTQISAPTASMVVATAVIVASHAQNIFEVFLIVSMAGILQILLGLTGVGRYIQYTPRIVVSGFMSGIGVIIIAIQLLPLFGMSSVSGGALGNLRQLFDSVHSINFDALTIGAIALVISIFWPRKFGRFIPAPLLAMMVGTLVSVLWLSDVPIVGHIFTGLPEIMLVSPSFSFLLHALEPALILALIGSVNSLLSSLVADTLTGTSHRPSRELIGQGIGNTISGLIGGLPGSGSVPGTVSNIRAGASTTVSGMSYPIMMTLILIGFIDWFEQIPLAALAGVLIKVGWDAIDIRIIRRMHLIQRTQLVILLLTFGITIFIDLLTAVVVGLIVSAMTHARIIERFELDSIVSAAILDSILFEDDETLTDIDPYSTRTGLICLNGIISIASKTKLVNSTTEDIKDHEVIIFDFSTTQFIEDDIALVIERLTEVAAHDNINIIMCGFSESIYKNMVALNVLSLVEGDHIVDNLEDAKQLARQIIKSSMT